MLTAAIERNEMDFISICNRSCCRGLLLNDPLMMKASVRWLATPTLLRLNNLNRSILSIFAGVL